MPTLNWIGKDAVVNHHQQVPFRLLKDVPDLACGDPGSGNLIVQGDNLEALKALLPYYAGQVKCIYIDSPYNTGVDERDTSGKRRPNMNFQEMGIPVGATLYFTQGDSTVTVLGPKRVQFGEEEMSLTAVTKQLQETDYNLPPALYWTYDGKLLRDIYNETYQNIE